MLDQFISNECKLKRKDLVFYIRVQYRRNTSWQGTIKWLDGRKSAKFRSVLELAALINDAELKATGRGGESKKQNVVWLNKDEVS
jgi:hypothetical protein